jgi:helicase
LFFKLAKALLTRFRQDNLWHDLLRHNTKNHWKKYVEMVLARRPPVWDFFPSQKAALEKGIFEEPKCISLQMPTSSGKTALCELVVYDEVMKNPDSRILFLAPYRSLAAELKAGLARGLARLGIKSKTIYGGNVPTQAEKTAADSVSLLISTPEKLLAFSHMFEELIKSFSVVVCDEGHLIDDEERGLRYELLLSTLKGPLKGNRRFIFLSAIVPNLPDINEWLGGDQSTVISSEYRPTRLNYAFLEEMEKVKNTYQLVVNPTKALPEKYIVSYFLTREDFRFLKEETQRWNTYKYTSQRVRSVAAALKSLRAGAVALFAPSKGPNGVRGLAEEVLRLVGSNTSIAENLTPPKGKHTREMKEYFTCIFGDTYLLSQLVKFGVLFHHGDLPQQVREVIEEAIRNGRSKFVICTNTLAEGVNLPIRTIVVHSARRYIPDRGWKSLRVRDLKNLGGRAGRAGKETNGMIIVANPDDFAVFRQVIEDRKIEPARGYLYEVIRNLTQLHGFKKFVERHQ